MTKRFHLGKYEVTQPQYRAVMGSLSKGMSSQLPTEAWWEHSCRAGNTATYWWGNDSELVKSNYQDPFVTAWAGESEHVGQYAANSWGGQDMYGKVYGWCGNHTGERVLCPAEPDTGLHVQIDGEVLRI